MAHPRTELETAQDLLGWDFFLEGILSTTWAEFQQRYYIRLDKRHSGHRWLTQLIKRLWQIAWDIWEYRNDVNASKNLQQSDQQLTAQIQDTLRQPLPATVAPLLDGDAVPLHPYSSISRKRAWLTSVNAHCEYDRRKRCKNNTPAAAANTQKLITDFLQN